MREIKFRAKPDKASKTNTNLTKAAIKREQCQTGLSIAEREQAPLDPKGRLLPTGRKNE